jgi:CelD/BcsL family acetyltransferase involved in cellulose biosynthesis
MQIDETDAHQIIVYRVLTRISEVEAIAPQWDEALKRSACNRAFSSAKWYLAACRHDPAVSPYVIIAQRGTRLAGILPLALVDVGEMAAFPTGLADYNDIVAAPDELNVQVGLLQYAFSQARGYRRLRLDDVRHDSNCARALRLIKRTHAMHQVSQTDVVCPYIQLSRSYAEYLKTREERFTKRLRYAQRRAERNDLTVKELQPETFPPDQLPEVFLSLHRNRYRAASCFVPEAAQSFVREIFPLLFNERSLRAFALFEGKRIIGINICMVGIKSLCYWNGGFLTAASASSPGKLLIDAGVRQAFAMQFDEYDFLRGAEDYKSDWANSTRYISRIEFRGYA